MGIFGGTGYYRNPLLKHLDVTDEEGGVGKQVVTEFISSVRQRAANCIGSTAFHTNTISPDNISGMTTRIDNHLDKTGKNRRWSNNRTSKSS